MSQDIIRVLRVIEYEGPRDVVEECVRNSVHGTRKFNGMSIRAATVNEFPVILSRGPVVCAYPGSPIPDEPLELNEVKP